MCVYVCMCVRVCVRPCACVCVCFRGQSSYPTWLEIGPPVVFPPLPQADWPELLGILLTPFLIFL